MKNPSLGEMNMKSFLARAIAALDGLLKKDTDKFMTLLDPNWSEEPKDLW